MTPPSPQSLPLRQLVPIALFLLPFAMLLAVVGCSAHPGTATVRFRSLDANRLFSEHFSQAYYSQSEDGDRTIVLVDEGLPRSANAPSGPIAPLQSIPLTQMIRFKILWNPLHGTQADAPSTTNCVIDWIIKENGANSGNDSLRYQGAGFVATSVGKNLLKLSVRSATLAAATRSGNLQDPLGQCEMSGSFTAIRNDAFVTTAGSQMDAVAIADRGSK